MKELSVNDSLVKKVIDSAYRVRSVLGAGLSERNYRLAMRTELKFRGIEFTEEFRCNIVYRGVSCGNYYIDLLVSDPESKEKLVVELKACKAIDNMHLSQTYNYMSMVGARTGLILNFGARHLEIRRLSSLRTGGVEGSKKEEMFLTGNTRI